jgi:hypothetical protein
MLLFWSREAASASRTAFSARSRGRVPYVVEHARHIAPPSREKPEFEFGLDLILDGLGDCAAPGVSHRDRRSTAVGDDEYGRERPRDERTGPAIAATDQARPKPPAASRQANETRPRQAAAMPTQAGMKGVAARRRPGDGRGTASARPRAPCAACGRCRS